MFAHHNEDISKNTENKDILKIESNLLTTPPISFIWEQLNKKFKCLIWKYIKEDFIFLY